MSDDVGLHCLDCAAPLQPATDASTFVCPKSHGTLVLGDASKPLLTVTAQVSVDHLAELLGRPGPRRRPCAKCGSNMSDLVIHQVALDLCGQCGALWVPHGGMLQLTGGAKGEPTTAIETAPAAPEAERSPRVPNEWAPPDSRPARTKGASKSMVVAGIGTLVAVACLAGALVAGYFVFGGEDKAKTTAKTPLEVFDQYSAYFVNATFGGQTLGWWQQRAEALAPGSKAADAEAFSLLVARGTNAGLAIVVVDGVATVTPDDRMKIALVKRMKLDK